MRQLLVSLLGVSLLAATVLWAADNKTSNNNTNNGAQQGQGRASTGRSNAYPNSPPAYTRLSPPVGFNAAPVASAYPAPPYYGYGGYGGGYGYGNVGAGSTPAGSYMTGMADAVRSAGQYNLMTSQAAINAEQAANMDIQNREAWTQTYFEMRRMNNAYREAERGPRGTQEQWVRYAKDATPARLGSDQLDPVDGSIKWPTLLTADIYSDNRQELNHLFSERAKAHGSIGLENYELVRKTTDDMLSKLKSQIGSADPNVYMNAKRFLESLAYEASFRTG